MKKQCQKKVIMYKKMKGERERERNTNRNIQGGGMKKTKTTEKEN